MTYSFCASHTVIEHYQITRTGGGAWQLWRSEFEYPPESGPFWCEDS